MKDYNTLLENEIRMAYEPPSEDEVCAMQRGLLLRKSEKTWIMRSLHRAIRSFGIWILDHPLRAFRDDLTLFATQIKSDLKPAKVFLLYRHIRRLRPQVVVEFGSGSSTAVIAALLELNFRDYGVDGRVISFEQNPAYYMPMAVSLPKAIMHRVQLNLSTIGYVKSDGYRQIYYEDCPDRVPDRVDLVFIDGPATATGMSMDQPAIFSGDMARLSSVRRWGFACTDIRYFNSLYFSNAMKSCCVRENVILRSIEMTPGC